MESSFKLQNRLDSAKETPLFYKVFGLIAGGMILDAGDVYMASAVNTDLLSTKFATMLQSSMFLSAGFLGLFVGSIAAGIIGDFYGRKKAYQINLLLFGLFTLIGGFMPTMPLLIITRFIAACGLGAEIVTGYALVNEFAPVKTRGRWCGACAVIANMGAPLALLAATLMIPNLGWRSMFFLIGALALLLWVLRRHFPESPRWLITQKRFTEAEKIITELEANGSYDAADFELTQADGQNVVTERKSRGLFVAIVTVSAIMLAQYTFTSWVPTLLVKKGINVVHSLSFSTIMMIGAPVGALIGALLIDHLGRKKIIVPAFIMAAILGLIYAQQTTNAGVLIVGFLLTMMFYVLMGSAVGVYISELFTTSFRFRGAGIANGVAKLLTVLTPYLAAWAISNFSANLIFYFIAILTLIAAIVVGLFGPETKQKIIG
ncbi:MFS transporter [Agrilactobacillus yilanensis]|uniref:MFS transporter n=1 Tax=Agrilactobacillus yilanensis TaxID=2485997 RepID=A0ABW4J4T8_9LACO|nr:MFS transporter [Agrilactobacillus yilanensis]